jgi:uncharacterized coiled-coil DUF342 family protein
LTPQDAKAENQMELQSLIELENQIDKLLDLYKSVKRDRDELLQRVQQLEAENYDLKRSTDELRQEATEAKRNTRDLEKEQKIRAKVDELLAKLEGF